MQFVITLYLFVLSVGEFFQVAGLLGVITISISSDHYY